MSRAAGGQHSSRIKWKDVLPGVTVWCLMGLIDSPEHGSAPAWRAGGPFTDHEEALRFSREWAAKRRRDRRYGWSTVLWSLTLVRVTKR